MPEKPPLPLGKMVSELQTDRADLDALMSKVAADIVALDSRFNDLVGTDVIICGTVAEVGIRHAGVTLYKESGPLVKEFMDRPLRPDRYTVHQETLERMGSLVVAHVDDMSHIFSFVVPYDSHFKVYEPRQLAAARSRYDKKYLQAHP
jgi:hypothetical protein